MRRAQRASKKRAAKAALTPSLSCTYVALPAVLARVSIAEAHARAKVKSTLTAPTFLMCLIVRFGARVLRLNFGAERQELICADRDHGVR
ncbi:MAG: hypothetical protein K0R41_1621 [Geminicoccaceae bacterium]|nr:hypothetical protein [Geminicoccaceae bacterium]